MWIYSWFTFWDTIHRWIVIAAFVVATFGLSWVGGLVGEPNSQYLQITMFYNCFPRVGWNIKIILILRIFFAVLQHLDSVEVVLLVNKKRQYLWITILYNRFRPFGMPSLTTRWVWNLTECAPLQLLEDFVHSSSSKSTLVCFPHFPLSIMCLRWWGGGGE